MKKNVKLYQAGAISINSAVATGLENVSFHFNPREGQCQRMFKLPYQCAHFTCSKVMLKNPSSQASAVCEPRTSNIEAWFRKGRRTRDQIANIPQVIEKAREFQKNIYFTDDAKAFGCVDHNKLWEILQEMRIADHLTCLLRSLYAGQEATVRSRHGTTDWFLIGKIIQRGCASSPCSLNFYAEYLTRNARLEESQTGTKTDSRNINNLRYHR